MIPSVIRQVCGVFGILFAACGFYMFCMLSSCIMGVKMSLGSTVICSDTTKDAWLTIPLFVVSLVAIFGGLGLFSCLNDSKRNNYDLAI